MVDLKLAKLPDRTPVKLTITISPDLNADLAFYAALYQQVYGHEEAVVALIPAMLAGFLESDKGYVRARRSQDGASLAP